MRIGSSSGTYHDIVSLAMPEPWCPCAEGEREADWRSRVKHPYRLILVDKDGVLVSEFQLTENDLANPEAFVDTLKRSIEQVEEEEL